MIFYFFLPPCLDIFEILLRPLKEDETVDESQVYSLESVLGHTNVNTSGLMNNVIQLRIPKYPALTLKQFKESSKYWPVQYRENK